MRGMPTDPDDPTTPRGSAARSAVAELFARVVVERGLDFEPAPAPVIDALPALTDIVEGLAGRCHDAQERRWLAAALAALSHHVQAGALTEPAPRPDSTDGRDLAPEPTEAVAAAVAVVTSPLGVLAGRRDGIPRWVFPGGTIEDGETAEQAAVHEYAEETGLVVVADHEIGRRTHPVTGQQLTYIACTSTAGLDVEPARQGPGTRRRCGAAARCARRRRGAARCPGWGARARRRARGDRGLRTLASTSGSPGS
jgi:hypothetical protein